MNFRVFLLILAAGSALFLRPSTECESGCQTTVTVHDCNDEAVPSAKVEIRLCCGGGSNIESTTDQHGQAIFAYCTKDMCGSRIVLNGFAVFAFDPNSCTTTGKTSHCTVKLCKQFGGQ